MKTEPVVLALESVARRVGRVPHRLLLTPKASLAPAASAGAGWPAEVVLVCGRYEGFDERIRSVVDEELSAGDFVLNGGEVPAMLVLDGVARLLPGVIAKLARSRRSRTKTGFSNTHTTLGRVSFAGSMSPRCYSRVTTSRSDFGGGSRGCYAPAAPPDLWRVFGPTQEDLKLLRASPTQSLSWRTDLPRPVCITLSMTAASSWSALPLLTSTSTTWPARHEPTAWPATTWSPRSAVSKTSPAGFATLAHWARGELQQTPRRGVSPAGGGRRPARSSWPASKRGKAGGRSRW